MAGLAEWLLASQKNCFVEVVKSQYGQISVWEFLLTSRACLSLDRRIQLLYWQLLSSGIATHALLVWPFIYVIVVDVQCDLWHQVRNMNNAESHVAMHSSLGCVMWLYPSFPVRFHQFRTRPWHKAEVEMKISSSLSQGGVKSREKLITELIIWGREKTFKAWCFLPSPSRVPFAAPHSSDFISLSHSHVI
jgi:hypothetical protein